MQYLIPKESKLKYPIYKAIDIHFDDDGLEWVLVIPIVTVESLDKATWELRTSFIQKVYSDV